jgi:hypothetical protein
MSAAAGFFTRHLSEALKYLGEGFLERAVEADGIVGQVDMAKDILHYLPVTGTRLKSKAGAFLRHVSFSNNQVSY